MDDRRSEVARPVRESFEKGRFPDPRQPVNKDYSRAPVHGLNELGKLARPANEIGRRVR